MKVAALDLGTNTFICLIAEVIGGRITKIYDDQVRIVRLGQGFGHSLCGRCFFLPEALERAAACLDDFSSLIKNQRPDVVLAMATSAARDAENREELFRLGGKLGLPIEIIPGGQEARITYEGSISGQKDFSKNFVVIDIGGGSTEIVGGYGASIKFSQSVDIGCVRMMERFLKRQPPTPDELGRLQEYVRKELYQIKGKMENLPIDIALAVAGTPTELAKILVGQFCVEKIDGSHLSINHLTLWRDSFSKRNPQQIQQDFGMSPGRSDVILVGVIILEEFCRLFDQPFLEVSTRGLRFGVAIEAERRGLS